MIREKEIEAIVGVDTAIVHETGYKATVTGEYKVLDNRLFSFMREHDYVVTKVNNFDGQTLVEFKRQ